MNATTNSCTCLDSPNMLYAPCQACSGEDFETGEIVQVSNCTFIGGSTDDDVVVKFDSSPFEYCLPGSAIRRQQPPPQAGSSGEGLKVDPLTHPLARSGEQQFAVLCRQRSGIDSGNITEVTRPFQIEELCNQDQKDIALSSINLAITVLRHCKTENKSDLMHWVRLLEKQVSNRIPPAQAEPVEAKEPWKPVVGEKVLVEAEVVKRYKDDTVMVACDSNVIQVPLAQLRPLPVVQGEGVGK